jgi:hypothetical protein
MQRKMIIHVIVESWFRYALREYKCKGCRGRTLYAVQIHGLYREGFLVACAPLKIDASFFKLIFQVKEPGPLKMIYITLVIVCKVETVRFIPVSTP